MIILYTEEQLEGRNDRVERLIGRIAEGDKDALGELYELIGTDVYAFALSKLGSKTDAEDILEDTFVRIYRYAVGYCPEGKPMAWIITIAGNLIKRQRVLRARNIPLDEAIGEDMPDTHSVEAQTVRNELVRELLSLLDDEEREIVVLHAVWGLKHREIAASLGKPLSTVLSKYNRAIKKLRNIGEGVDS